MPVRAQHSPSASDQDFIEIVLSQEEAVSTEVREQFFDFPVGVDPQNWVRLGILHFDFVRASQVVAAKASIGPRGLSVEYGEDSSAWVERIFQPLNQRLDQALRNVVQSVPEQHHVKLASAEVQVLLEESRHV